MGIVKYYNGSKAWWVDGRFHREDGPAIEWNDGGKHWWVNGQLHRVDGPAIEDANGTKFWYMNGQQYSYKEWLKIIPNNLVYLWRCYCEHS